MRVFTGMLSTFPKKSRTSRYHIPIINQSVLISERKPNLDSSKFSRMKSDYKIAYEIFEKREQHDNTAFHVFERCGSGIIYTYIFIYKYLHLLEDVTRSIQIEE